MTQGKICFPIVPSNIHNTTFIFKIKKGNRYRVIPKTCYILCTCRNISHTQVRVDPLWVVTPELKSWRWRRYVPTKRCYPLLVHMALQPRRPASVWELQITYLTQITVRLWNAEAKVWGVISVDDHSRNVSFMEPSGSSPCQQNPTFSILSHLNGHNIHCNVIFPSMHRPRKPNSTRLCTHLLLPPCVTHYPLTSLFNRLSCIT
jgi:hypothetical protein